MDELPKNILRFDVLRIEYGMKKQCTCRIPHYEIDYQNRIVRCEDCGAILDPLEALTKIARHFEHIESRNADLLEQRRQIEKYKPHRVVIKELEKRYSSWERKHLQPCCPRCGEPFDLRELTTATRRRSGEERSVDEGE